MKLNTILWSVMLAATLAFSGTLTAYAQEPTPTPEGGEGGEESIPACTGETVTGTVVATDMETNTITIYTETGLCTVQLGGDHDNRLVDLLGAYFDGVDLGELTGSMEPVGAWATYDEATGTWTLVDEGTEGAYSINVLGVVDNGDGTWTISFLVEGSDAPQQLTTSDPAVAQAFTDALAENQVTLDITVDEEGNTVVTGAADEVAALREQGLGFGVIVKLMAISQEFGVPLEELVAQFQSGIGLGQLYQMYGMPEVKGVGHVFQASGDNPGNGNGNGGPPEGKGPDKDGDGEKDHGGGGGNGNGNGGGNGNGNGNGGGDEEGDD